MKRGLILVVSFAVFLLVEGCYLGGAVRRAVTGEPPDPSADGATGGAHEALYVTAYAILRELAGAAANYINARTLKRAGDMLPPPPPTAPRT